MNEREISSELHYLKNRIADCETQLASLPPGKLIVARNGQHFKWYVSTNGHRSGISCLSKSKENLSLAEALAKKNYLTRLLQEYKSQKKALLSCLQSLQQAACGSGRILSHPEYQKLLHSSFTPENSGLQEWASAPHLTNPTHSDALKYPSPTGHILRSKSEVIIDMTLAMHHIPFRYEDALELNDTVYYPDFTIRHPATGEYFYWEHFGLVDQPDYLNSCLQKLRLYMRAGIVPTVNLITTYETNQHPLSPQAVDSLIRNYFL